MSRKYRIAGTYHVELEIETELKGQELFEYYAGILNAPETKLKARLVKGDRLFICACGQGYSRQAARYCSNCGSKHNFDAKSGEAP